ncbi:MAG: 6-pyruvoyl tetrahydropterin synthase [Hydrocarboniphaga sp.]|uniref:6-carboxytetrahydropterin synthase n=1 Tax=Hydrocarboniphaga sp. TaxID=2033016 RepID=UPI00262E9569|nr:6-carboxytetrahydropterin synthase [Hydrocarboniphaga sp.]MDB5967707.1 6-pyruvoyl tetrahydropterin synthase [Hydrocarboniphaga sp.]
MTSLFVEQLTVIDCAYLDAARGLVGESWIVDIELIGDLDEQSMVLDFGEVKRRLKQAIDGSVDHTLVVPRLAPELSLSQSGAKTELVFRSELGAFEYQSPPVAVSLVEADAIDAAAVAAYLKPRLAEVLPPNVSELRLHLRNERIEGAYYHYTHGLKKHKGHCQRIAHGHRSRIEIRVDGQRAPTLEAEVAARWLDIYLGTNEDLVARGNGRLRFAYQAPEGRFEIALPEARVERMDGDTTVERIAEWLAQLASPGSACGQLEIRAYEGVMKGAVARRTRAAR